MPWYEIHDNLHIPGRWHVGEPKTDRDRCFGAAAVTTGRIVRGNPVLHATSDGGVQLDFTLGALEVPYVSQRLAQVLRDLNLPTMQLVPVEVDGNPMFILNATQLVRCLDESRSSFTKWTDNDGRPERTGRYRMVITLAIDPSLAQGKDLFRVAGWEVPLIVSERVRAILDGAGLFGIAYTRVA